MLKSIIKNIVNYGVLRKHDEHESIRIKVLNVGTIATITVNLIYFIFLIGISVYSLSLNNLVCLVLPFLTFYFIKIRKYNLAKLYYVILTNFILLSFEYFYGDLGTRIYYYSLAAITLYIFEEKRFLYFPLGLIIVSIFFAEISLATGFLKPYNNLYAYWGEKFYWSNYVISTIWIMILLIFFKIENFQHIESLDSKNREIEKKNEEINHQIDKLAINNTKLFDTNEELQKTIKVTESQKRIIDGLYAKEKERLKSSQKKNNELIQEKQILAQVSEAKNKFFTNITHEFRTPLTLIIGPVKQLINEKNISTKHLNALQLIERNASHLNRLISQLLDIAKLDARLLKVSRSKTNITKFFNLLISTFHSISENKGVSFIVDLKLASGLIVEIDEDKLEKIVYNLLSNAFKFTESGGQVILCVDLSRNLDNILIEVKDTGQGIHDKEISKIFDRFYQVNNRKGNNETGTGIGLTLVKELIELLKGKIYVESNLGQGTCFKVNIPIPKNTVEFKTENLIKQYDSILPVIETQERNVDVAESNLEKPLLLLVEDNRDLRHYMVDGFKIDYNVKFAENGVEGFKIAKELIPDIILTDVMMPKMGGITFCNKIKSEIRTKHIPIIIITAKAETECKIQGLKYGADDYIYKPFEFEELLLKSRNWLARRKLLQEKYRLQALAEPTKLELVSDDEKFLFKLKKIIEEEISNHELSVDFLSRKIGFSRVQLYRKLKALTGFSVNEFVRTLRLKKAASFFDNRILNVSTVAYDVGFNNLSYFTKCFKNYFGQSPSQYIRRFLE